jgi:hypothetical protein
MDRAAKLTQLAKRLARLSAERAWDELVVVDRELAALLPVLAARQCTAAERASLAQLQEAHEEARKRCASEITELGLRLLQMRVHKDGWIAYAMNNELDEGRA